MEDTKKNIIVKTNYNRLLFFLMRFGLKIKRIKFNPGSIKKILKEIGISNNMKILDFGCGQGYYSIEAANLIGSKGRIIAADIYKGMINDLSVKIKRHNIMNIIPRLISDADDIRENNFDIILLFDVLHFITNKTTLIKKLLNKLSTKGKLIIKYKFMKNKQIEDLLNNANITNFHEFKKNYLLIKR